MQSLNTLNKSLPQLPPEMLIECIRLSGQWNTASRVSKQWKSLVERIFLDHNRKLSLARPNFANGLSLKKNAYENFVLLCGELIPLAKVAGWREPIPNFKNRLEKISYLFNKASLLADLILSKRDSMNNQAMQDAWLVGHQLLTGENPLTSYANVDEHAVLWDRVKTKYAKNPISRLNLSSIDIRIIPISRMVIFKNIMTLHLNNCKLHYFPLSASKYIPRLQALSLDDNQFMEIPEGVFGLKGLTRLSIKNNQITEISKEILKFLPLLQEIYTDGNPLNTPIQVADLATYVLYPIGIKESRAESLSRRSSQVSSEEDFSSDSTPASPHAHLESKEEPPKLPRKNGCIIS